MFCYNAGMRLFIGSVVAFFAVGVGDLLATTDYVNLQSGWQYRWSDSPVDPSTGRATWLDSPWDSGIVAGSR